jgi:hypothetical protein
VIGDRVSTRLNLTALGAAAIGVAGCAVGAASDPAGFFRAWLCAFLFWLGLPLAALTLVLVHDLTGGRWMATARPLLDAAIATMPLASLAGIPAFIGLHHLYSWTHPSPGLGNIFYLNSTFFFLRYAIDVALWNALAAFALWAPRAGEAPIAPALSWLSGVGLILLAFSASFAAIDWIMSIEPTFWSAVFPMIAGASWFNTGLAFILLIVAVSDWREGSRREHMADLTAILLATTIFWAYVEFCQFLIVWEENLKSEIAWYLPRLSGALRPALVVSVALGFLVPFFVLLWRPSKRSRAVVAAICLLILSSRVAHSWWLVLPQYPSSGPLWLDIAGVLALGGMMLLLFVWRLRYRRLPPGWGIRLSRAHHG